MKKTFLLTIFCAAFVVTSNAQAPAKAVFFEIGGPGVASINYDMRFELRHFFNIFKDNAERLDETLLWRL